jgi:hypothetical protein
MLNPNIHLSNTAPQVSPWACRSSEPEKGTLSSSACRLGLPARGTAADPLDGSVITLG